LLRKIVKIDEEKCNGCGICIPNCAEGALQIIDGKARLVSEVFCDGLGACLGDCPQDAITIEEREADEFDEIAVEEHLKQLTPSISEKRQPETGGCPGSALRNFNQDEVCDDEPLADEQSQLSHWPVQLMLVPPHAPFLKGADLIICADCVPFAVADFHKRYLKNRAVLVGCPKFDDLNYYRQKLTELFKEAQPSSITVLRMEVPCCGGIASVAIEAHDKSVPGCPLEIHTVGIQNGITKEVIAAETV